MSRNPALSLRLIALFLILTASAASRADIAGILQLVDYVGVDYPAAVSDGAITNRNEYAEMQEFSANIAAGIRQLPPSPGSGKVSDLAGQLQTAVDNKAAPAEISALTRKLRSALMADYDVVMTPRRAPDMATGRKLYQDNCAACHGEKGLGNGPMASALDPAPTNFHDADRARQRSLYGLYNTITLGVEGTAMPAFGQLSDARRWSLAFYVGSLYITDQQRSADTPPASRSLSLYDAIVMSPAELADKESGGGALAAWFRTHPGALFAGGRAGTIDVARDKLEQSLTAYRAGDFRHARKQALAAYLEGFELSEAALGNISRELVLDTEKAMMAYRQGIEDRVPVEELEQRYDHARSLLLQGDEALSGETLTAGVAFTSSLIILLREGLEAILVLAAMIAFMYKTQRREALHYLHAGWITALVLGGITWVVSSYLLTITGATRELTEGVTALVAAGILLYVGFWMHGNANARNWNRYLKERMEKAFDKRTLWAIGVLAFLAVYREAFETVLFYQALWAQSTADSHTAISAGAVVATMLLVLCVWLMTRFGLRLPLKQFFMVSASLMIILAVIFAGQGIAALHEAGKVPLYPLPIPRIELLGIFPNSVSIALQLFIILLATAVALYRRRATA